MKLAATAPQHIRRFSRGLAPIRNISPKRPASTMATKLLVVSSKDSPELAILKTLPADVEVIGIGQTVQDLDHLSAEQWASITVLVNAGVGARSGKKADIQEMWPRLTGLKWMHSASAGLEHLLFPELVDGPVILTNAKGVYSHSLAEYTLTACNWFAKDLPRMRSAQKESKWDPYDVEELRGKTLGIVGYGDIGQACAGLARAFKMNIAALRRTPPAAEEKGTSFYTPDRLNEMMSVCDYIVMATPYTPSTHQMINTAAVAAMKPTAVFINVGRGKCVDEQALIEALQAGNIRGAALDVFAEEPLPQSSPLWGLDNVLLSPHCADRTKEFQVESLQFFVQNLKQFSSGQELLNVCDKQSGY